MAYDPNGEWGLRRRVRVAYELTQSYAATASQLGVDTSVVLSFLTDSSYIPSPADVATMVSNLANIIPIGLWSHERETPSGHTITYVESASWTPELIAACEAPPGATSFIWTYMGDNNSDPSADGSLKNSHSHGYPEDSPLAVAQDIVVDQYDLLRTLTWFASAP